MNGLDKTIEFGGEYYGLDNSKLSAATNKVVNHLGTIEGQGSKVMIGGQSLNFSTEKVRPTIDSLHEYLGSLEYRPGLYQNGKLVESWDSLVSSNINYHRRRCDEYW